MELRPELCPPPVPAEHAAQPHAPAEDCAPETAGLSGPRVPDITRAELVEIVRRILAADEHADYYVLLLEANVPHPRVADLIFWPPPELVDAPPERIVDAALSYRPIAL
jgi:hypothetical protein